MNDVVALAVSSAAGIALGGLFFGGLFVTVMKGARSRRAMIWFLGSMMLRTSIVITGFYFVGHGHIERLCACILGFLVARFAVMKIFAGSSHMRVRQRQSELPSDEAQYGS